MRRPLRRTSGRSPLLRGQPALAPRPLSLRFDHVQFYLQSLRPLASYQQLESDLAAFGGGVGGTSAEEIPALAERWRSVASSAKPARSSSAH